MSNEHWLYKDTYDEEIKELHLTKHWGYWRIYNYLKEKHGRIDISLATIQKRLRALKERKNSETS